ncbi:ABC transporter permease [Streptomyces sp. NP160]|uniref:ABC transporter permease n=1 Tax=Streptomyces sp. NP160 TaxID=2586637 RepID=UPI001119F300|nr:ABC transporter permease [Streptomyces sp. NP160]TNM59362.1 ABC transporter permease [Streptomyces sp. NP160]
MTSSTATAPAPAPAPAPARRRTDIGALLLEGRAFLALVAIFVIFSALAPNAYPTVSNVLVMASHVAIYALLAMGMLLVILNGGIDLSVGSTLGMAGMVAGFLMKGVDLSPFGAAVTLFPPVWVVALVAIGVGALIGLVNGVLVARFNVAPFVATLGTLYAVRGLASLMTNGLTYNSFGGDEALGNTGFAWLGFNRIATVPIGVLVMVAVAVALSGVLNRSVFGRWLYASGGNERAAELSGVPVKRVKIWVYVVSGVTAAIAGLILTSQLTSAGPTAGTTYELTAIAAVVIGGAALSGGRGTVRGTLLGAFVIGFLSDGLVIVGVSVYWQTVFTGAVIVAAVLLNSVQYRGGRRPAAAGGSGRAGQAPPPTSPTSGTAARA